MGPYASSLLSIMELMRHRSRRREEIIEFQNKRLRHLVGYAYEFVPYYRNLFDRQKIKPEDITTAEDLSLIPVTGKNDVKGLSAREVVSSEVHPERLITHKTSGSSGYPFVIRRTWFEERIHGLLRKRIGHFRGRRVTDKSVSILFPRPKGSAISRLPLLIMNKMGLYRRGLIDCTKTPEEIILELRMARPDIIFGVATTILRLTEFITEKDLRIIRPRYVGVSSEVITDEMKRRISSVFSAPVFETYASFEFGIIAWECRDTGQLHVCDDGLIVEILKDGLPARSGEMGEVVITNLFAFAMPFIRFSLGDFATRGDKICRCGKPFSTIHSIEGRMIDFLRLPGGRVITPYQVNKNVIHGNFSWIKRFQIVQERADRVVLRLVPLSEAPNEKLARMRKKLASTLGDGVESEVIVVRELGTQSNGKFRLSHSHVGSYYDNNRSKILDKNVKHDFISYDTED